jgi:hypothetical protein
MFRFIIRTIVAAALSFAVKQYLEGEVNKAERKRVAQ